MAFFRENAVMARPLRIEYPGAVYHVTARGNARQRLILTTSVRDRVNERPHNRGLFG
jgi:hypothetical protein